MLQVNMFDAKTNLSRLVKLLETKQEDVIYIARNGEDVARLMPISQKDTSKRLGIAEGKMTVPADFDSDEWNKEIEDLFLGGEQS